ncbi:hypothetical protein LCGC14_2267140 [marine sediment metagenome]|uniref:Uncharacterized protein n=1 Tax=marine sediment metagenome TaxID=412755 RepID=A0A0F9CY52_9ZZZZ
MTEKEEICGNCLYLRDTLVSTQLVIDSIWKVLIKPKGFRFKILKWLCPELREIARILREDYYWKDTKE